MRSSGSAIAPCEERHASASLITAIGVSLFLEYLGQIEWHIGSDRFFGPTPTAVPRIALGMPLKQGGRPYGSFSDAIDSIQKTTGLSISGNDLLTFGATIVSLAVLLYIVRYTRTGKAMRAVSVNYDAAKLMGININRVISLTFVLGSAFAAVGGMRLRLPLHHHHPLMGILPGLKAFIAAVIGGIGNIPGAAVGGLILGLVEAFIGYLGSSQYQDAAAFIILIVVLLVRPEGIFGKASRRKFNAMTAGKRSSMHLVSVAALALAIALLAPRSTTPS